MWRTDRIGQRVLSFLLIACVFGFFAYLLLCDQIGHLAQVRDEEGVTLAGRVTDCRSMDKGMGRGSYRLEDPTGEISVVTRVGIWGPKRYLRRKLPFHDPSGSGA